VPFEALVMVRRVVVYSAYADIPVQAWDVMVPAILPGWGLSMAMSDIQEKYAACLPGGEIIALQVVLLFLALIENMACGHHFLVY